jgi:hypothetical protein
VRYLGGGSIRVQPLGTLCTPVSLILASYAVPASWDGKGFDASAVPQHLAAYRTLALASAQSVDLSVDLPCGPVQMDLFYPPLIDVVGPHGHGKQLVWSRLWPGVPSGPSCGVPDHQAIRVCVPPGTLTLTTPYTPDAPLDLGTLSLDPDGTQLDASAPFSSIVVTDTRLGALPWSLDAQASSLTGGTDGTGGSLGSIAAQNLGLTDVTVDSAPPGVDLESVFTAYDHPPAQPAVQPDAAGSAGLGGGVPHLVAETTAGRGSWILHATLTLVAPTSTAPGTYTGTVTLTVG